MNTIPFWQPAREYNKYKQEFDEAIQKILSNGELVLGYGQDIPKFEYDFAKFCGVKHAVMCGAGTQALYLAYRGCGIKRGDEVITTSHTFIATIDQIVALGAKPILVDIGDDGLIDPVEIEKAITKKTKAIVPVHLEGKVCKMDEILDIANRHNLIVIEDGAQAIGAKGIGRGKACCFSMFPAKALGSFGNSGMVITNDDDLAERLKMMRCNWNIGKNPSQNVEFGVNMEPDNLQAAVLNIKLKYFPERLLKRREIAGKYDEAFKDLPIILPFKQEGRIYQDYVIRITERKDDFCQFLKDKGIGILGHNLIPNHLYKNLKLKFKLPLTESYVFSQVRIPCSPDLTDEEVDYVIKVIKEFYGG